MGLVRQFVHSTPWMNVGTGIGMRVQEMMENMQQVPAVPPVPTPLGASYILYDHVADRIKIMRHRLGN